jgi:S1-C subfamily serine protease
MQKRYATEERKYRELSSEYRQRRSKFRSLQAQRFVQNRATIVLVDNSEYQASIVRVHETIDLALLRLSNAKTPYIPVADPRRLAQGDALYAIGNPLNFSHSVSAGVFSGHQRGMLMTSTPINPGNSGGPLVTREGEVVGINTQKIVGQGVEGIGFAVPIHVALGAFEDILDEHMPRRNERPAPERKPAVTVE